MLPGPPLPGRGEGSRPARVPCVAQSLTAASDSLLLGSRCAKPDQEPDRAGQGAMPRPPTEPEEEARAAPSRGGAQAAASPRLRQALSPRLQAAAASPPARLSAAGQRPLWGQEPVRHTRGDEGRGPAHWCLLCNQRAQPERSGMSPLPCQGQQEAAWTATALPLSDPPCSLRQGLPGVLSLPRSWALDVHPGGRPSPRRSWQLPSHLGMCGAGVSRLGLQARPGQPPRA